MSIIFRARSDLLATVRHDLERRHTFAAERVGFLGCSAGRVAGGGLVILAASYDPVADEDYIDDRRVGAMMGTAAIRKALQRAYHGGAGDISMFHVHMHEHEGIPGFSQVDLTESMKFVPDFFNVAPQILHGAIVLSRDRAAGLCWRAQRGEPTPIDRFASVGAPLVTW
jgi:hypothetical protein